MLARVVEPTSKLDSIRVLTELGIARTVVSHDQAAAAGLCDTDEWRQPLACGVRGACRVSARRPWCSTTSPRCTSRPTRATGSASPGSPRNAGWSRRSPSGLLTDVRGFPLQVHAFDGNTAETKTILPVIQAFAAAHGCRR